VCITRLNFAFLFFVIGVSHTLAQSGDYARAAFERLSPQRQIQLQLGLIWTGHLNALIDLRWGRRTRDAIIEFQRQHGLVQDGVPTPSLINRIEQEAGRYVSRYGYTLLDEPRSGLQVGIPLNIISGRRWSADQRATFETFVRNDDLGNSYRRFVARADQPPAYNVLRNGFFVIAGGEASGMRYYIRALEVNNAVRGVIIRYTESLSAEGYDRVVVATSALLLPMTTGQQPSGPPPSNQPPPPVANTAPSPPVQNRSSSSGSGFFVSESGHILTNHHVVSDCSSLEVVGRGRAGIVRTDPRNDLALVRIATGASTPAAVFRQTPAQLAEAVFVFGYPFAQLGTGLNVTTGSVSAVSGIGGDSSQIQLTAPIQPGNSGGPIVDSSGAVVGLSVAKLDDRVALRELGSLPQNVNFGIRSELATLFLRGSGVEPRTTSSDPPLAPPSVAQRVAPWTVQIVCRRD
jgi:serine protease Do